MRFIHVQFDLRMNTDYQIFKWHGKWLATVETETLKVPTLYHIYQFEFENIMKIGINKIGKTYK